MAIWGIYVDIVCHWEIAALADLIGMTEKSFCKPLQKQKF